MKQKKPFSLRARICIVAGLDIFLLACIISTVTAHMTRSEAETLVKNAMLQQAENLGESMELLGGLEGDYYDLLDEVSVEGIDGSYAYLVAADKTMLFHPTAEKIGQPVENEVVTALCEEIAAGTRSDASVITYTYKNAAKYAGYYIAEDMSYIIVVTADKSAAMSGINSITTLVSVISVAFEILAILALVFIVGSLTKPLKKATASLNKLGDLDLTDDAELAKLAARTDEPGEIARAIMKLTGTLREVTGDIKTTCEMLKDSVAELNINSSNVSSMTEQIGAAVDGVAEGANSQAEETQSTSDYVLKIGGLIEENDSRAKVLREKSAVMEDSAGKAMGVLDELKESNAKTEESMEQIYEQVQKTNEAAENIRAAIEVISNIAEETNLLSLNANIEAARAGEQGRGFAVVATQISTLADQSAQSAVEIQEVIEELLRISDKNMEIMEMVKKVVDVQGKNVELASDTFNVVKDEIDQSVENIEDIAKKTMEMDEERVKIVDAVQGLSAIAEENAASAQESSASVAEVKQFVENISHETKMIERMSDKLSASMKQFTL